MSRGRSELSFRDLLAQYGRSYGEREATHDRLSSALGTLIADGVVTRVGSARPLRYRLVSEPPSAQTAKTLQDEVALAVSALLREHFAVSDRPHATREIGDMLRARGLWPDRFARLRRVLDRMSSEMGAPEDALDASGPRGVLQRIDRRTPTGRNTAV